MRAAPRRHQQHDERGDVEQRGRVGGGVDVALLSPRQKKNSDSPPSPPPRRASLETPRDASCERARLSARTPTADAARSSSATRREGCTPIPSPRRGRRTGLGSRDASAREIRRSRRRTRRRRARRTRRGRRRASRRARVGARVRVRRAPSRLVRRRGGRSGRRRGPSPPFAGRRPASSSISPRSPTRRASFSVSTSLRTRDEVRSGPVARLLTRTGP
mmetsp:Transcript_12077/g.43515  ORF Transcript_12077/g.43515 Transcript_12077/m.43515 type:complete len:218 (+) Transcript_12077:943-1596(+)